MSKSKKTLLESQGNNSVYRSIEECPIWNWMKIQETGDLTYLGKASLEELEEIYLSMQDEIFEKFGINDKFKTYLMYMKQKASILHQMIIEPSPFLDLDLHVVEEDLKMLMDNKEKQDLDDVLVIVEKFMGFQLDPKKVSVKKYYSYLKSIEKHGKAN